MKRLFLALALLAVSAAPSAAFLFHGGGSGGSGGALTIALQPVFHNPGGSATGSIAFWEFGQPSQTSAWNSGSDDIPSGYAVTSATLGGVSVPASCLELKKAADGAQERGDCIVDFGTADAPGASIGAGSSATLILTAMQTTAPNCGAGGHPACRTAADWEALNANVQLTSVVPANSSTAPDMAGSGTWNAVFDGGPTNTVRQMGSSPQGSKWFVYAAFVDNTPTAVSSASWSTGAETLDFSANPNLRVGMQLVLIDGSTQVVACTVASVSGTSPFPVTCPLAASPGTITAESPFHRNLIAATTFTVTETTSGALGPIRECGPEVDNILLHLTQSAISTLTGYTYNATFNRNGSAVRTVNGITAPHDSKSPLYRPDGQCDWTSSDPGVYVTHDVTQLIMTQKVPPIAGEGITYTGSAYFGTTAPTVTPPAGGGTVWTIGAYNTLGGPSNGAVAVEFSSTGSLPTGISANTLYWTKQLSSTTFSVYDNFNDAFAGGATGKITTTSSGSGTATATLVAAPNSTAQIQISMSTGGPRPDIQLLGEWFAGGYMVGQSQAFQQLARVTALGQEGEPFLYDIEATTLTVPALIDAGETPSGPDAYGDSVLSEPTTNYGLAGIYSSNVNGGSTTIAGSTANWSNFGSGAQHIYDLLYGVWLLEADDLIGQSIVELGNAITASRDASSGLGTSARIPSINGTNYYAQEICNYKLAAGGSAIRSGSWAARDDAEAAVAAFPGSVEETYYDNKLSANMTLCQAYQTFKGANWQANGVINWDDNGWDVNTSTVNGGWFENFMEFYTDATIPYAAMLRGDYVGSLLTEAQFTAKWVTARYGSNYCQYYAAPYNAGIGLEASGDAEPGAYISSPLVSGLNADSSSQIAATFTNNGASAATITANTTATPPWTLQANDLFQPTNYNTNDNGQTVNTPPAPFSPGRVQYFIQSPSGVTFELASTASGTPIVQTGATTSSVQGFWIWQSGDPCPSTGSFDTGTIQDDSFFTYGMSALAVESVVGVSAAGTRASGPWFNAWTRYTNTNSQTPAQEMGWLMTPLH